MRKVGLIATLAGLATLAAEILLRGLTTSSPWLWIPGPLLLSAGSALLLKSRAATPAAPTSRSAALQASDTGRMLDSFEQRFAELKARKPSATVLDDLYTLGTALEMRGRATQATAVYRHLARVDNTYRDVGARLRRLMDAERARNPAPAAAAPATAAASPAPRAATPAAAAAAGQRPTPPISTAKVGAAPRPPAGGPGGGGPGPPPRGHGARRAHARRSSPRPKARAASSRRSGSGAIRSSAK